MALVNEHFLKLPGNYLFADIAKRVNAFKVSHPKVKVISLGIGDVTRPLAPVVIEAMHKAVDEMSNKATFRGYGPERGYDFLREAIQKNDFLPRGIHIDLNEIFVNDGAKSDTGNIQEILRWDNNIGVTDPIYPVYVDSNAMIGRAGVFENGKWTDVTYFPCTADNNFVPQIPDRHVDMIYLCYPNNPTGTVLPKEELRKWVNFALRNDSILFYDAAYEAYITDPEIPHSIYEIKGADRARSSTEQAISASAPPKPSTHQRARNRSKRPSTTTWRTQRSCARRLASSAIRSMAVSTLLICGSRRPTAWTAGSSSNNSSTDAVLSARRVWASDQAAKAISA